MLRRYKGDTMEILRKYNGYTMEVQKNAMAVLRRYETDTKEAL